MSAGSQGHEAQSPTPFLVPFRVRVPLANQKVYNGFSPIPRERLVQELHRVTMWAAECWSDSDGRRHPLNIIMTRS